MSSASNSVVSLTKGNNILSFWVIPVLGGEVETKLLEKIKEGIDGMEKQTSTAEKFGNLEKGPATFGVAKTRQEIETELHSDQQVMYVSFSRAVTLSLRQLLLSKHKYWRAFKGK